MVRKTENAEQVTLKMMLQHQSGIPNITPNFWTNSPNNSEDALKLIVDLLANFELNAEYEYSNTNYLLIAQLIDKAIGYSHHQYIKEEILIPLELKNTFSSLSEVNMTNVMSGYYIGVEEDIKTTDCGSMLATAEDVGIFLRTLNDGTLLDKEEQEVYSSVYVYDHTGLIRNFH